MCKGGKTIKLCSCEGDAVNENAMWVLYSERLIVGSYLPASPSAKKTFLLLIFVVLLLPFYLFLKLQLVQRIIARNWLVPSCSKNILKELNQNTAFDFDYKPRLGDVLVVHLQGEELYFKFTPSSGWSVSNARETKLNYRKSEIFKGIVATDL